MEAVNAPTQAPEAPSADALQPYLVHDKDDASLVALFPCDKAATDPDAWHAFEAALKERHRAKHPVDALLRQQDRVRKAWRYWRQ